MIMYVIPTTWSREKVFTLLIEAVDKLRAEAKCTTVCGRRINIFLYSPRTHFSSVKHVLIINLFNTHTRTHTQHLLVQLPSSRSNGRAQLPLFVLLLYSSGIQRCFSFSFFPSCPLHHTDRTGVRMLTYSIQTHAPMHKLVYSHTPARDANRVYAKG